MATYIVYDVLYNNARDYIMASIPIFAAKRNIRIQIAQLFVAVSAYLSHEL